MLTPFVFRRCDTAPVRSAISLAAFAVYPSKYPLYGQGPAPSWGLFGRLSDQSSLTLLILELGILTPYSRGKASRRKYLPGMGKPRVYWVIYRLRENGKVSSRKINQQRHRNYPMLLIVTAHGPLGVIVTLKETLAPSKIPDSLHMSL